MIKFYKIILRPICWAKEIYYTIKYCIPIDGHEYISKYDGYLSSFKDLECKICGKISKVREYDK